MLNGKLNLAPVKNPKNVLDIGTGTGIWAIEFGENRTISHGTDLKRARRSTDHIPS